MDSNERVIQALHEFENMTDADKVLTQELEDLFIQIAHTGRIQIPWIYLKPVFMFKLDKVMRDFFESSPSRNNTSSEPTHTAEFDVMRQRLLDCIESFTGAPFTVQRLCELMVEPKRHYRNSEKFMRGVEKNILVVSTMSDIEGQELPNCQENDTIPNGPVTNGIITTGSTTEMSSISDECCESNGQHQEHYHDTHYPTLGTTLQINGNGTLEKRNDDSTESTETELSEDKLSETPPAESSDAEKSLPESEEKRTEDSDNSGSGDSSDSFSEETAEEQQSNVTSEQDEKNTEDKEEKCSDRIEENESGDDKEDVKQDSQEQKDTKCEERIENKQVQEEKEEDKKDEEEASTEEPMEE